MRSFFVPLACALAGGVGAQQVFTVCGVQEFCFCWDDPGLVSYTFLPCPDSVLTDIHLLFCSGQMALVDTAVIRAYDGPDNTADPIAQLTGTYLNLTNLAGTASTAIHIEFDFPDTIEVVCQAGDTSPWRWLVWTGYPATSPVFGDCTGTDPLCMSTGISAIARQPTLAVRDGELLLPPSFAHSARIELLDSSGRTVGSLSPKGRASVALPTTLRSGVYMAVVESGTSRTTARFVLHD